MPDHPPLLPGLRLASSSARHLDQLLQLGAIEAGGAHPLSFLITRLLLEAQNLQDLGGDILEIGVLHGHCLGLLASTARQGQKVIGCDIQGDLLNGALASIRQQLATAQPWLELEAIACSSASLQLRRELPARVGVTGLRFVHIDGEHSCEMAKRDMQLCAELMAPWGLIGVDDVFNSTCPGVTEALFAFSREADWRILLFSPNKAFLCRPRYFPLYRRLGIELPALLRELHGYQAGLSVSGHEASDGYLSLFPTEQPYYQVVSHGFGNPTDFQAYSSRPDQL